VNILHVGQSGLLSMLLYATTDLCVAHANGFHEFMNITGHLRSIILYRVHAQTT
jgi:hypothetical protein